MTAELNLRDWQHRHRLKDAQAAHEVRLSVSAWRRQRDGLVRRTEQTEALTEYYELKQEIDPVRLAEIVALATKLIRLTMFRR